MREAINSVGFVISHKNNERRRAVLPSDLDAVTNRDNLYFETGYGASLGYSDEDYANKGAHIVSRSQALQCNVLIDVKLGDEDYLSDIEEPKILVGWAHAVQGVDFTTKVLKGKHTVLAWEEIYRNGRYIFYKNREIAGEAAVLQAYQYCGKMPYDTRVAVLGNGQTAKGALRVLYGLGAEVNVFGRKLETLFKEVMFDYDVIVNCVLWDTNRTDRIIYRDDLQKFKTGTLLIDVSCNHGLEIETTHPTTIDNPVYEVDGVIHYAVDNTPAMFPVTVSNCLSKAFAKYIDDIICDDIPQELRDAVVIKEGVIIDPNISNFRTRLGIID